MNAAGIFAGRRKSCNVWHLLMCASAIHRRLKLLLLCVLDVFQKEGFHGLAQLQFLSLSVIAGTGAIWDLRKGRIPNALSAGGICCGLVFQGAYRGGIGIVFSMASVLLPLLLLGWLYYFRMIGAGDIKLLCAVGAFMTPGECFQCVVWSIFFGGVWCVYLIYRNKSIWRRIFFFLDYIREYGETRQWKPYASGALEGDRFCFSVPVLLGTIFYLGGIY